MFDWLGNVTEGISSLLDDIEDVLSAPLTSSSSSDRATQADTGSFLLTNLSDTFWTLGVQPLEFLAQVKTQIESKLSDIHHVSLDFCQAAWKAAHSVGHQVSLKEVS